MFGRAQGWQRSSGERLCGPDQCPSQCTAAAHPAGTETSEFKPYKSPDGLFSVKFPGEPKVINAGPSIPDKMLEDKWYRVELKPRIYSVRFKHYDRIAIPRRSSSTRSSSR